jgi:hypothetical protein
MSLSCLCFVEMLKTSSCDVVAVFCLLVDEVEDLFLLFLKQQNQAAFMEILKSNSGVHEAITADNDFINLLLLLRTRGKNVILAFDGNFISFCLFCYLIRLV